jgi:pantetheine-phosphate adenylyltransferase
MNRIAIYPGSFDPITLGHVDIIERSSHIFDHVIVNLAINPAKTTLFNSEERKLMVEDAVKHIPNVTVESFDGLVVEFAKKRNASAIIRGLRAISDFEYEFQMALMNRSMAEEIDTVFLMPDERYTYLNSSIVRNVASFKGDIRNFVTNYVAQKLINKFKEESAHELDR